MILYVLVALVAAYLGRLALARRARASFCTGGCVTMAVRLNVNARAGGWRHGYARLTGDVVEWRSEKRIRGGADMSFDRDALAVKEHHQVRKGEVMLSELTELVDARYKGEPVQLGILRTDLDTFLAWPRG